VPKVAIAGTAGNIARASEAVFDIEAVGVAIGVGIGVDTAVLAGVNDVGAVAKMDGVVKVAVIGAEETTC